LDFFGSFLGLDGYDPWDFFGDPWDFFGSFLDPYDFDPWISLVHSLVLMGTTLGISLVTLGISWISLILGSILGISLVHGYDPWDFLVL